MAQVRAAVPVGRYSLLVSSVVPVALVAVAAGLALIALRLWMIVVRRRADR